MMRCVRLVAACSALIVMASCEREPTGQSLAVVNGEEISAAELNSALAETNLPANADRKVVARQVLQNLIDARLLAQAAEEQGIAQTPEFLNRERRLRERLLVGLLTERRADSMKVPDTAAVDEFIAENAGMFVNRARYNVDQLVFDRPADGRILQALADDQSLADIERTLTSLGISYTRGNATMDTASVPPELLRQIEALAPGEPFVLPIANRMVASVITGRQPVTTSQEQNRQAAAGLMRQRQLEGGLRTQLKQLRASAEIKYQPGFEPTKAAPAQASGPATKSSS